MLAVAADLRRIALMDRDLARVPVTGGASIYPFCWSILLSARSRGLGGVMTTFLSRVEPAAAPLLGLPEHHALVATIFLGVPEHVTTKLSREPVEHFTTVDRFDGEAFTPTVTPLRDERALVGARSPLVLGHRARRGSRAGRWRPARRTSDDGHGAPRRAAAPRSPP